MRRDEEEEATYYPEYPRYVKLQEKSKPYDNIAPYCQQMQILYDGLWNPLSNVPIVTVQEVEPTATSSASASATAKARLARGQQDLPSLTVETRQAATLDSDCVCVWEVAFL